MIDSKRLLPSFLPSFFPTPYSLLPPPSIPSSLSKSRLIYIYLSLQLSAQLSASRVGAGTCWSIYSQRPHYQDICSFIFFSCCAELSKSVLVHRTALSHWRPSTTNVPQRAEERPPSSPSTPRVYPLHQAGSWSAAGSGAGAGVTPSASWQPQFGLWQAPGTRIPGHVSLRRAAWLVNWNCAAIRNLPPRHQLQTLPVCPPHSAMLGQPLGFFYMNYALAVCSSLLTSWLPSPSASEPSSQSLNVLAIR